MLLNRAPIIVNMYLAILSAEVRLVFDGFLGYSRVTSSSILSHTHKSRTEHPFNHRSKEINKAI